MTRRKPRSRPAWTDVKTKLAEFDRKGLIDLVHDLYGAHKDNQTFLHTRFGLGGNVLEPYKNAIERWMSPDVFRNQNYSVAKARQAIVDYKGAVGDPAGLAELMVYFCERSAGFSAEFGNDGEEYYDAVCRMFAQALAAANTLPPASRDALFARLDLVRGTSRKFGYGVEDRMDYLLANYVTDSGGMTEE